INKNLLHRPGGGLEEMATIGELLLSITCDLQPGLMHERRGLQRLSGFFIGHPDDGEFAQFLIDQREEFFVRSRLTPVDGLEDPRDIAHCSTVKWRKPVVYARKKFCQERY